MATRIQPEDVRDPRTRQLSVQLLVLRSEPGVAGANVEGDVRGEAPRRGRGAWSWRCTAFPAPRSMALVPVGSVRWKYPLQDSTTENGSRCASAMVIAPEPPA